MLISPIQNNIFKNNLHKNTPASTNFVNKNLKSINEDAYSEEEEEEEEPTFALNSPLHHHTTHHQITILRNKKNRDTDTGFKRHTAQGF